jgi:hypothetical protein
MMLDDADKQAIIPGGNGVFQATVVRAGRVTGTWKRTVGRTAVTVDVFPLAGLRRTGRAAAERAFTRYGEFLGLPVVVRWPSG